MVGSPDECAGIEDPEVLLKVHMMVKRAYAAGVISGFLLFMLVYISQR